MCRKYKFDERYIEVTDDVYEIIRKAYQVHGSFTSLGRTLNISPRAAKFIVERETKHINRDKLQMLKCLCEDVPI